MMVGSVLEMYVTHFGWIGFNAIMTIFFATFIIYLPLVFGIASAWFEGIQNTDTRPGVLTSLRRIELKLLSFVVVFMLCAVPFVPLSLDQLSVIPTNAGLHIDTPVDEHTVSNDPTTLSGPMGAGLTAARSQFGEPSVPIFWMLVMQVSSGITHAAVQSVPASFDIRAAQMALGDFSFQDQGLASELNEFIDDCYLVARGKFDRWSTNGQFSEIAPVDTQEKLKKEPDMINWIGSPVFRETPGLYAQCNDIDVCGSSPQSSELIAGWPYNERRDGIRESAIQVNDPGQPWCKEWWEDGDVGLRARILNSSNSPGLDNPLTSLSNFTELLFNTVRLRGDLELARDIAVERAIQTSRATAQHRDNPLYGANDSADRAGDSTLGNSLVQIVGGAGALYTSGKAVTQGMLLKSASYVLQGSLLFIIYALLPFILLFTAMSPTTMITGGLFIFSVKFLTALWAWANFLETKLHEALFPEWPDVGFVEVFMDFGETAEPEAIYNIVSVLNYLVFPMVWLMVVGFAGVQLGRGLSAGITNTSGATSAAASAGMSGAKGAASKGLR